MNAKDRVVTTLNLKKVDRMEVIQLKSIEKRVTIVCISLILIGLIFTGLSYAKIDSGTCVGLWLFDEGEGDIAKDSSGNGNDGKIIGEAEWVEGKFGKALDFDGVDDYVDCGNDESINKITDAITVVAWGYSRTAEMYTYILSNDRDCCGNYRGYSLCLNITNAAFFQIWDSNNTNHRVTCGKPSLEDWHHLAGTYDGNQLKIYLDGEFVKSLAFAGTIGVPASFNLAIGGMGFDPKTYNINGVIDEVAIFRSALTEKDLDRIMNKGLEDALGMKAVSKSGKLATVWGSIKCK